MNKQNIDSKALIEITDLVKYGDKLLLTQYTPVNVAGTFVDKEMFNDWKSEAEGFLKFYFGEESEDYQEFKQKCISNWNNSFLKGFGIIKRCKIYIEKLLSNKSNNIGGDEMKDNIEKLFISHSSNDRDYIKYLIDLIEGIGLSSERIFCTSFEGYGIGLGENFLERIKRELNSNTLVIFTLSNNFYSSPVCLCEMGATWIKTQEHIPILIPPFGYEDIKGVIPSIQGFKINEKDKLNTFKKKITETFNLKDIDMSIWERKRDSFIENINRLIG